MKILINKVILFNLMGLVYFVIEVAYDGDSHWSMYFLGGLCGYLIGLINERYTWNTPLWEQVLIGELIVLPLEFIVGCIVNLWLKWNVWDYSNLPFNILGQSSLAFVFVFIPIILLAIFFDDYYRWLVINEDKPRYRII